MSLETQAELDAEHVAKVNTCGMDPELERVWDAAKEYYEVAQILRVARTFQKVMKRNPLNLTAKEQD